MRWSRQRQAHLVHCRGSRVHIVAHDARASACDLAEQRPVSPVAVGLRLEGVCPHLIQAAVIVQAALQLPSQAGGAPFSHSGAGASACTAAASVGMLAAH